MWAVLIQKKMPKTHYSQSAFWEERYKQSVCEHYEWLTKPEPLITIINKHINLSAVRSVLEIGCGTSHLLKHLVREIKSQDAEAEMGDISGIDFSKEVIKKLRNGPVCEGANYSCMDVRQMKGIENQTYDLIIDKGTMDCVFCEDNLISEVIKAMRECYRVLKDGGSMVIISHGKPKFRRYLFRNKLVPFNLSTEMFVRDRKQLYMYVCTKGEGTAIREGLIEQRDQQDDRDEEKKKKDEEDINKKKQADKDKESKAKKENSKKKKESEEGQFILPETKKKESVKKDDDDEPRFILDPKPSTHDGTKEKKEQEPRFILGDGPEQEEKNGKESGEKSPKFILGDSDKEEQEQEEEQEDAEPHEEDEEANQKQGQQNEEEGEGEGEEEEQHENGDGEQEEEGGEQEGQDGEQQNGENNQQGQGSQKYEAEYDQQFDEV